MFNRTQGTSSIMPELVYPDVGQAVDWLCDVFGFTEIWRVGNHRARVGFGNGVVIVADAGYGREALGDDPPLTHAVMVQVEDADAHYEHARQQGAAVGSPPESYAYGERQYSAVDIGGHHWTFSQSIADVAPEDWGGTSKSPLGAESGTER